MPPALTISIKSDVDKLTKQLDAFARKQMPFAAARAVTAVASAIRADVTAAIPNRFDRPVAFTRNAVGVIPAAKGQLSAEVFVKEIQAGYLQFQEVGGTELPKKTAIVLPINVRRNAAGNMPRFLLKRLHADPNVFVGTVRGVGGFWRRLKTGHLQLLVRFVSKTEYKPRFGYHEIVKARIAQDMMPTLKAALDEALKTARR